MSTDQLKSNYWSLNAGEVAQKLESSATGLSSAEAAQRLAALNSKKKVRSPFMKDVLLLLSQFKNPLVLLLVAAIILSAILGETDDAVIILVILVATGSLSFIQERNAGRAVEKLRSLIRTTARVMRNGITSEIFNEEVVPGDVLLLSAGDILPADCLLLESKDLFANEATLTGESYPAEKEPGICPVDTGLSKRKNVLFQGSSIVSGSAKALVVFTGDETVLGETVGSLEGNLPQTAFEKGIASFGYLLLRVTIALAVTIVLVNIYFKRPVIDSLIFGLALSIGMAPEMLPAIMTIAMSVGAKRMSAQKVIVKKLASIQNLGEVNLLCSDKTGTLTEGVLKVSSITNSEGAESEKVRTLAYLNAFFETGFPNPMDIALRDMKGIDISAYSKLDEVPYDFLRKCLSIVVVKDKEPAIITKGAFNSVIGLCTKAELGNGQAVAIETVRDKITALYEQYSNNGFRAIGVCSKNIGAQQIITKDDESEMTFMGFVLLYDPPKADVIQTVKELRANGVEFKMITGDNALVAGYIAQQIGLSDVKILDGKAIRNMSPDALIVKMQETTIFAEIEPQQKEHIIKVLQQAGNAVAYMGDGINDVAAINAADVGISTNNAVDVAKEAADVVLLEKDLGVLNRGIIEGRRTFLNTIKYIYANTSGTFGSMFSMAGASLILPFLPMLPKQILLINFMTDFPYMSVASDNVDEDQLRIPQKWHIKQVRNWMLIFGMHSSAFDYITFFLLYAYYRVSPDLFRSGWFIESMGTQLLILFVVRTHHSILKSKPGILLLVLNIAAFAIAAILPFTKLGGIFGFQPLHLQLIMIISGILITYTVTADLLKLLFFKNFGRG